MNQNKKRSKSIEKHPIVAIVGCIHGDELIGKRVMEELKRIKLKKGKLITIIGNKKALRMKRRFVDQDLNRSFPGRSDGNYEQRLACDLKENLCGADFVIDIHSTVTDVKDLVIITKVNSEILDLLNFFAPRRVALMTPDIGEKALTYYCKAGISLEYGKDKNMTVQRKVFRDIMIMLAKLDMIDYKFKKNSYKPEFYKIEGVIKKQKGFNLNDEVKNFKFVKKGALIASNKRKSEQAKKNFYPILFGKKSYQDIYGFAAKKVEKF